jgi:excisionase family DNA binding protein
MPQSAQLVTTAEAARALKVTQIRIAAMCRAGVLPATKRGRDWYIKRADLEARANNTPPPGRPRTRPAGPARPRGRPRKTPPIDP